MKIESDKLIINYTNNDKKYIKTLEEKLDKNINKIMNFFDIKNINNKIEINILENKEIFDIEYKKHYNKESNEWNRSFIDNSVYILSYKDYRDTIFYRDTFDEFVNSVLYEITQILYKNRNNDLSMKYINEGLKIYFSNMFDDIDSNKKFDCDKDKITNEIDIDYIDYYMIMKYIINNYKRDFLLKLIDDKSFAYDNVDKIYKDCVNFYNRED